MREVEIDEAVVVKVPRGNAHAVPGVTGPGDAGLLGDIGKPAVALVAVEPVRIARMRTVDLDALVAACVQTTAVEDEDVEQSVAIVVE